MTKATITNGDKIRELFPNLSFENESTEINEWHGETIECQEEDLFFDLDWWNAPYKAESEAE